MPDTLLTYTVKTNPDPVQVSTPQNSSLAKLTIVVSNSTRQIVEVKSISFGLPVGTNAKDFLAKAGGDTSKLTGWSFTLDGSIFTAKPDTAEDGKVGAHGLVFTISGLTVNQEPGTSHLDITEEAAQPKGTPPEPLAVRKLSCDVAKFPANFTVGDLNAEPLSVPKGGSTTLSWTGTAGAIYTIEYDDKVITQGKDGRPLPATGSYTIGGIRRETVFNLVVKFQAPGRNATAVVQRSRTVEVIAAEITKFIVFPLTVGKGAQCNVSWETNADQCVLDPGASEVAAPDGSQTMTFDETTNLTLTAVKLMDVAQASRTVTVVAPVIKSFEPSAAAPVDANTAVTLSWETQYASSVTITPGVGAVAAKGTRVVQPQHDTTYTLACTGLGNPVTREIKIRVKPVEITKLEFTPKEVEVGGKATLTWDTLRATSVSLDNGIGVVAANGSRSIELNPQSDLTLTLTCQGPNGPLSRAVTLRVKSVRITKLSNDRPTERIDQYSWYEFVDWATENATRVQLSCDQPYIPGPRDVEKTGTYKFEYSIYQPGGNFTLTAWGPGRSPVTAVVHIHSTD